MMRVVYMSAQCKILHIIYLLYLLAHFGYGGDLVTQVVSDEEHTVTIINKNTAASFTKQAPSFWLQHQNNLFSYSTV